MWCCKKGKTEKKIPQYRNSFKIQCQNRRRIQIDSPDTINMITYYPGQCRNFNEKWRDKLVLLAQISPPSIMMRSWECFPHVSKLPTFTYNRAKSVIIKKNSIIFKIMHDIFNLCDIETVIYILLGRYFSLFHSRIKCNIMKTVERIFFITCTIDFNRRNLKSSFHASF